MSLFDVGTMTDLLNRSLTGAAVILAVLVLRLGMKRFPKKYVCLLWLAAFGRLLFFIPVPSASGLIPAAEPLRQVAVEVDGRPGTGTVLHLSTGLEEVSNRYDAMGIVGNGASFNVQQEAGVDTADLFIAVTGEDELNLLCCLIAKKNAKCHTIARVRNPLYNKEIRFIREQLGISMIINPELTTAREILKVLKFPSAIKIDTFAKGRVELLHFRVKP